MIRHAITALAVAASLTLSLQTMAEQKGHGAAAKGKAITPQTTCPVMGGKINPKLYADAAGKRIYVCCQGCIPAIRKAPSKYIKKLEEQGVTVARLQTTCPVMGGKINPKLYADVDGKRIYVCCQGCIPAIRKAPSKYIKKLAEQGFVVADTPKKVHGEHDGHQH